MCEIAGKSTNSDIFHSMMTHKRAFPNKNRLSLQPPSANGTLSVRYSMPIVGSPPNLSSLPYFSSNLHNSSAFSNLHLGKSLDSPRHLLDSFDSNSSAPALLARSMASMGLSDRSSDSHGNSSSSGGQPLLSPSAMARTTLPSWAFDDAGNITASLADIILRGQLCTFACDKIGCHYLQEHYPKVGTSERSALIEQALVSATNFDQLCGDVFANFFLQCVIANAAKDKDMHEQDLIVANLKRDLSNRALSRYSCRVVQKAVECLDTNLTAALMIELTKANLVPLCVDQNANHVIQKMVMVYPSQLWCFLVDNLLQNPEKILSISENKYGCRVIQLIIEQLCERSKESICVSRLNGLMAVVMKNCSRMASNEFANYVVQHIIKTGPLAEYRNAIIDQCLLRNLLSMSQEKYASHVVETAFENAPSMLLKEMMEEIFDGSGIKLPDMADRMEWLRKMQRRILDNEARLSRYSSGKKIIDTLRALPIGSNSTFSVAGSASYSISPSASASLSPFFRQPSLFAHSHSHSQSSSPRSLSASPPSGHGSLISSPQLPPSILGLHQQQHAHSVNSPMVGSYSSHHHQQQQQEHRSASALMPIF
ncbi:hypothetical protein WR25_26697 [Diploscapter pachys]|uniref:PUM-HD domain-containing protein n=1 Tax=Diploscapter pachys TaxID=2018661 RepID=A0A2A2L8S4_9BILA|nr:hypothetical protein WR25_26697 [Diploscapter pachys]